MRLQTPLAFLSILILCAAPSCSSNLQPPEHGEPATGGATGTGGMTATGGTVGPDGNATGGQGGAVACGSATCTAGEFCCNAFCSICAPIGSACVAGCAVGGNGGSGTGGSGPPSNVCASLAASYQAALAVVQSCGTSADGGGQCGVLAAASIPVSGCPASCDSVWVNDATPLTAIRQQWLEAGCQGVGACPQASCEAPPTGYCAPVDGGQGLCQTPVWLTI